MLTLNVQTQPNAILQCLQKLNHGSTFRIRSSLPKYPVRVFLGKDNFRTGPRHGPRRQPGKKKYKENR